MYKFYPKVFMHPPGRVSNMLLIVNSVINRISAADKRRIVMRINLTTLIIISVIMQVSATSVAQKVTLTEKKAALVDVFNHIRAQTGFDFLFTTATLADAKPVSIQVTNVELNDVLTQLFKRQQLDFRIENRSVIVSPKIPSLLDKVIAAIKALDISGKVVDEKGMPIPGATVRTKDNTRAATTDANGNFTLKKADDQAIIVISSIGFLTKELNIKAEMGTITLEVSNSKLDEIMVLGYNTTTRRLSTGSTSQIKAAELDQQPISNPILGLEGRVPGAFITQSAGYSGAQFNIQIRGQNSISTLNAGAPLYIVDGIPFNSMPVEQTAGLSGSAGFSPLNTIDPTDIESIDILKDADATAIYGSRGAEGVVLITTKKGKAGNTKVSIDLSSGFGDVTHTVPLLGTDQYLSIRRQAFANDALISTTVAPTTANAPDLTVFDQHAYTDFNKLLMGNTQHQSKATFDISGGDQYTQFLFGGNYRHESTVLPSSTADNGVQFHLNTQHQSQNHRFGVSVSASYNVDDNAIPNAAFNAGNLALAPNYPLYNTDGSLYWRSGYTNPLGALNATYSLKSTNLITNASLHYMVAPGLDLKINAGYNYDNVVGTTLYPSSSLNPTTTSTPQVVLQNNYIKTYIAEPQATYTHTWGKGKFTAIVGGTWQETQLVQPYYISGTYTSIQLASSLANVTVSTKASGYQDYKYNSGFARAEYEWNGKYLFSGNIRRDGSSRFGANKPFGNFGSGAFAWIFSKEQFIANNLTWLSFGKLKTSYGSVGSDKTISNYQYLSAYSAGIAPAYGTITPLAPSGIANPNLQWEETNKLDIAIELGFIHDRIFFSADVYRNRTSHLLAFIPLPTLDGFGSLNGNLPDGAIVQNQGIELELSTVNIKNKDFSWKTSFNFTAPQNKLIAFPDLAKNANYANFYVVGQSLNLRKLYHFTGFVNGVPTVQDVNGDGVITAGYSATGKADYVVTGNSDPKFYGGLDNTVSYKGITLNFLFQFVKRTAQRGDLLGYPGLTNNLAQSFIDLPFKYSATSGAAYPTSTYTYYTNSDAAIQDASFIRLKNVSLSYNVPQAWAKKVKMSTFQVYLHGQNLLTFTSYKGYDPETLTAFVGQPLPTLKMLVAGIKTTF